MTLELPRGMEWGFRHVYARESSRFSISVYGSERGGWFTAAFVTRHDRRQVSFQPLEPDAKDELLRLIDASGFWTSPALVPMPDGWMTLDGGDSSLAGRTDERSHHVEFALWENSPFFDLHRFLCRLSTLMPDPLGRRR